MPINNPLFQKPQSILTKYETLETPKVRMLKLVGTKTVPYISEEIWEFYEKYSDYYEYFSYDSEDDSEKRNENVYFFNI